MQEHNILLNGPAAHMVEQTRGKELAWDEVHFMTDTGGARVLVVDLDRAGPFRRVVCTAMFGLLRAVMTAGQQSRITFGDAR